jgi:signal transduction histidine kinase
MEEKHSMHNSTSWFLRTVLSVPIYVKVLGIGVLVALLFGSVSLYQIRAGMRQAQYRIQGETAIAIAKSLAGRILPLMGVQRKANLDHALKETMSTLPTLRYIFVLDAQGKIASHGMQFPQKAPPDVSQSVAGHCAGCHGSTVPIKLPAGLHEARGVLTLPSGSVGIYRSAEEVVLDVSVPIPGGAGAVLRMGMGDRLMMREVDALTRQLLLGLGLCALLGFGLSLFLAYVLVRPIHGLVQVANRIHAGDFTARAQVHSDDEVGSLAVAMNEMGDGLERYCAEVFEKDNARRILLKRLVEAQEDERKRLARELHDQLGQSLSHTLLTIETSCQSCTGKREHCCNVKDDIRGLIDEVRRLAWHARPAVLDDYGLAQALTQLVSETARRASVKIDYQCVAHPEMPRLDSVIEVTLYRICQEALTNIVRHAEAKQASVILLQREEEVSLIVEDDGKGISEAKTDDSRPPSMGLVGMRERASLVEGALDIDSASGKGCTIRVRIPLTDSDNGVSD